MSVGFVRSMVSLYTYRRTLSTGIFEFSNFFRRFEIPLGRMDFSVHPALLPCEDLSLPVQRLAVVGGAGPGEIRSLDVEGIALTLYKDGMIPCLEGDLVGVEALGLAAVHEELIDGSGIDVGDSGQAVGGGKNFTADHGLYLLKFSHVVVGVPLLDEAIIYLLTYYVNPHF